MPGIITRYIDVMQEKLGEVISFFDLADLVEKNYVLTSVEEDGRFYFQQEGDLGLHLVREQGHYQIEMQPVSEEAIATSRYKAQACKAFFDFAGIDYTQGPKIITGSVSLETAMLVYARVKEYSGMLEWSREEKMAALEAESKHI